MEGAEMGGRGNGKPKATPRDQNALVAHPQPGDTKGRAMARAVLRPGIQAAATLKEYTKAFGDIELMGLVDELAAQARIANDGDLSRAGATLAIQAHTLDGIFNNLARRAINAEYMDHLDRYLRLAFKAQSQCRATLDTLAQMKNPPQLALIRQQNVAVNQQVNNGAPPRTPEPSHARETDSEQNKLLLEVQDGQRLDTGAAGAAGRADKELEPVGALHRAEDGAR
jgi:hypothetical protein